MENAAIIPEVRFNLKSHKGASKGDAITIFAIFRYDKKRLRYTTGENVVLQYWNFKSQRAKESVNYTDGAQINKSLEKIRATIRDYYRSHVLGNSIELVDFKIELDYLLKRKQRPLITKSNHKTLYQFIEKMIQDYKKDVNGKHGQTWQKFKTVYNHISTFGEEMYKKEISYDDITIDFKDDFVEWLRGTYGHSENNISKIIRVTKQFMKESMRYHNNPIIINDRFSHKRVEVPKNFPSLDELKILFRHKFEDEEIQKAIDLYLISAFGGGLRWSDIDQLNADNEIEHDGERVLQVFTYKGRSTKADNEVIIPITPQLRSLIKKYNWRLPKIKYHEVNQLVRDGFEQAKINRKVNVKSGIKGKKAESKKLYEVIHFHTSRYSYINYMINDLDISAEELCKITGQSLKVLLKYEQGNKKKNATKVGAKINRQLEGLHVIKSDAV